MTTPWYNVERVSIPGSVILSSWKAQREAERAAVKNAGQVYPTSSGTSGSALYEWLTGAGSLSSAGPAVTERTALAISAVYACISLISGAILSLPIHVYKRSPDGRDKITNDLWWLLNDQPSPTCTAAVFWEYIAWSLLLHGDAFARILRAGATITGFDFAHPLDVSVVRNGDRLAYLVKSRWTGEVETRDQDDMLHIPGLGFDGLRGLSPLRYAAKQTMGLSLAADEYSARFFSNGARPDYVITTPGKMDGEQQKLFRESWMARYAGTQNAHIPAILTGGGDVKALSLNPEDAQLLQTRGYQASDIARFYGVPPHMIGLTDKVTSFGAGIEQQSIGFVKYTLSRHIVKIEQEINRKCFRGPSKYAEFCTAGLERGDTKTRNEAYRIGLGRAGEPAWLTVNEVRKLDNLPPIDGGDVLQTNTPAGPAKDAIPS